MSRGHGWRRRGARRPSRRAGPASSCIRCGLRRTSGRLTCPVAPDRPVRCRNVHPMRGSTPQGPPRGWGRGARSRMSVAARIGCMPLSGRGSGPRYVRPSSGAGTCGGLLRRSGVVVHPMRLATNERPPRVPGGARSPRPVSERASDAPIDTGRAASSLDGDRPIGMSVAARIGCTPLSGRAILNVRGSATTIAVPVPGSATGHDEAGRGVCRAPGREWRGGATCPSC